MQELASVVTLDFLFISMLALVPDIVLSHVTPQFPLVTAFEVDTLGILWHTSSRIIGEVLAG